MPRYGVWKRGENNYGIFDFAYMEVVDDHMTQEEAEKEAEALNAEDEEQAEAS